MRLCLHTMAASPRPVCEWNSPASVHARLLASGGVAAGPSAHRGRGGLLGLAVQRRRTYEGSLPLSDERANQTTLRRTLGRSSRERGSHIKSAVRTNSEASRAQTDPDKECRPSHVAASCSRLGRLLQGSTASPSRQWRSGLLPAVSSRAQLRPSAQEHEDGDLRHPARTRQEEVYEVDLQKASRPRGDGQGDRQQRR